MNTIRVCGYVGDTNVIEYDAPEVPLPGETLTVDNKSKGVKYYKVLKRYWGVAVMGYKVGNLIVDLTLEVTTAPR